MATNDHGRCPKCDADLNGGSIWETGYKFAKEGGEDTYPSVPAASEEEALKRADRYAAAYGATRTTGQWGRQIGIYDMEKDRTVAWQCPDCGHQWPR